jgi:hypothetical protein
MKYTFIGNRIDNGEKVKGEYYFKSPLTVENHDKSEDGLFFLSGELRDCISNSDGVVYIVDPKSLKIELNEQ